MRLLTLVLVLLASFPAGFQPAAAQESAFPLDAAQQAWVDETLASLTLEQRAAQLFTAWAGGYYMSEDNPELQELVRLVDSLGIGGILFGIGEPLEQAALANYLQGRAGVPLLVSQDTEWGLGMRLDRATSLPRAMAIGATRNLEHAFRAGYITGVEARALGVQLVLAPVADVNNNPLNPVINTRSFGESPELVAEMASAFARGVQAGGAVATLKHFPGHGDTAVDSHVGLPVLDFDRARLDTLELVPFVRAVTDGVLGVMIGHLALPEIEPDRRLPATISPRITRSILLEEMKFGGLVVSDAMTMSGLSRYHEPGEAAVRAIEAGIHMMLKSHDFIGAHAAVMEAVESGRLSEATVNDAARKVLEAKAWAGLHQNRRVDLEAARGIVAAREHLDAADEIMREAITMVGNEAGVVPLSEASSVAAIVLSDVEDQGEGGAFVTRLRDRFGERLVDVRRVGARSAEDDVAAAVRLAGEVDVVVVASFVQAKSGRGTLELPAPHRSLFGGLHAADAPAVLISFGDPYLVDKVDHAPDAYVLTYGSDALAQETAVDVLSGNLVPRGVLPITLEYAKAPSGARRLGASE